MTKDATNSSEEINMRPWHSGLMSTPACATGAAGLFSINSSEPRNGADRLAWARASRNRSPIRTAIDSVERIIVRLLADMAAPDRPASKICGVGVDVVDILRIERLVHGSARFASRWFTSDELDQCSSASDGIWAYGRRLAVKEAAWKSLGLGAWQGGVPWRQISTVERSHGFTIECTGSVAEACAGLALGEVQADFVDSSNCTIAVAVATGGEFVPDRPS